MERRRYDRLSLEIEIEYLRQANRINRMPAKPRHVFEDTWKRKEIELCKNHSDKKRKREREKHTFERRRTESFSVQTLEDSLSLDRSEKKMSEAEEEWNNTSRERKERDMVNVVDSVFRSVSKDSISSSVAENPLDRRISAHKKLVHISLTDSFDIRAKRLQRFRTSDKCMLKQFSRVSTFLWIDRQTTLKEIHHIRRYTSLRFRSDRRRFLLHGDFTHRTKWLFVDVRWWAIDHLDHHDS